MDTLRGRQSTAEGGPVTPRDREVLRFIHTFRAEKGFLPALDEIGAHFSLGKTTVFESVGRLRDAGLLVKGPHGSNRAIDITDAGRELLGLSHAGRRVVLLPVLHSSEALRLWLRSSVYRERVPAGEALASSSCEIRAIAAHGAGGAAQRDGGETVTR